MKGSIKAAIITGMLGVVGTVSAAVIGLYIGKNTEQQNIQNEINEAFGDVVNVIGDSNDVTVNDIRELVQEYQDLKKQNASLVDQNTKYFDDLEEVTEELELLKGESGSEVERLNQQLNEMPSVEFKDMGLCMDGNDVAMDTAGSSVVVNNRVYYSDEFIKNLVGSGRGIEEQEGTLYIGKIIKEQEKLSENWIMDRKYVDFLSYGTDTYGNNYTDPISLSNKAYVTYSLKNEHAYFRCRASAKQNAKNGSVGNIIIKADGREIYKSPDMTMTTVPFDIDIAIQNCDLLSIEFISNGNIRCLIADSTVYN